MRAVNLVPPEAKRSGRGALRLAPATYGLLGGLLGALVLVTAYVLAGNTVATRQAQETTLRSQLSQDQAQVAQLGSYAQFASAARARVAAVRGIAATRFDWYRALSNLARAIPANTSLQSLNGSVVPGAGSGGASGGLRADQAGPAFEMTGCTHTQDDVARLISRLRTMAGVTRVSLSSSTIGNTGPSGGAPATAGTPGAAQGCGANTPTFNLVVFYTPVPGAGATGAVTAGSSTGTSTGGAK
jgi:Tfp pilus assembly protein PilN